MVGLPMKSALIVTRRKSWLSLFWIFLSRSSHGGWGTDLTAASFIRLEDPLTWPAGWCWCIGSCPHEPGHVWASQKDAYVSSWLSGWPSPEWAIWERKRKRTRWRYHFYELVLWSNSYQVHIISVQFSHSAMSDFLWPPWTTARQASLSITNSRSLLKLMSIESVMSSNHLILCHPLLLHLQSVPVLGSLPMSQFFPSGGQSIGVSPSNEYSGLIFFRMD